MNFWVGYHISWPIQVKFGIEGVNEMLLNNCEFRRHGCSESYALLRNVNTRWFRYDRDKLTCLHTNSPGHIWTTLYIHVRIFYIHCPIWVEKGERCVTVIQLNIFKFRENRLTAHLSLRCNKVWHLKVNNTDCTLRCVRVTIVAMDMQQ